MFHRSAKLLSALLIFGLHGWTIHPSPTAATTKSPRQAPISSSKSLSPHTLTFRYAPVVSSRATEAFLMGTVTLFFIALSGWNMYIPKSRIAKVLFTTITLVATAASGVMTGVLAALRFPIGADDDGLTLSKHLIQRGGAQQMAYELFHPARQTVRLPYAKIKYVTAIYSSGRQWLLIQPRKGRPYVIDAQRCPKGTFEALAQRLIDANVPTS